MARYRHYINGDLTKTARLSTSVGKMWIDHHQAEWRGRLNIAVDRVSNFELIVVVKGDKKDFTHRYIVTEGDGVNL